MVHRDRQPGGGQEHGGCEIGAEVSVCRQGRQRDSGHWRHPQLRLVFHQRRHLARHRRPLCGARRRPLRVDRLSRSAEEAAPEGAHQRHPDRGQSGRAFAGAPRGRDSTRQEPAPAGAGADRDARSVRAGVSRVHQGRLDRRLHRVLRGPRPFRTRAGVGCHAAVRPARQGRQRGAVRQTLRRIVRRAERDVDCAHVAESRPIAAARRAHVSARICSRQAGAARIRGDAVRGKPIPVRACVPGFLFHQCTPGRRCQQPRE